MTGSLDFVGYFTEKFYGCPGRVWVELKVWGTLTFAERLEEQKLKLSPLLEREQRKDESLCGVLLVRAC